MISGTPLRFIRHSICSSAVLSSGIGKDFSVGRDLSHDETRFDVCLVDETPRVELQYSTKLELISERGLGRAKIEEPELDDSLSSSPGRRKSRALGNVQDVRLRQTR